MSNWFQKGRSFVEGFLHDKTCRLTSKNMIPGSVDGVVTATCTFSYGFTKGTFAMVLCAQKSSGQLAGASPVRVRIRPPCSDHPASGAIRASKRCHHNPTVRSMKRILPRRKAFP